MAQVSDHVIKAMGFQTNDGSVELSAFFFSLHVFEFHGINLPDGGFANFEGQIAGVNYAAAIGMSVNELCTELWNDDYADDELTWQDEKKCSPPYLMVRFGLVTVLCRSLNSLCHLGFECERADAAQI